MYDAICTLVLTSLVEFSTVKYLFFIAAIWSLNLVLDLLHANPNRGFLYLAGFQVPCTRAYRQGSKYGKKIHFARPRGGMVYASFKLNLTDNDSW